MYPKLQKLPTAWPKILEFLEKYTPRIYYFPVKWRPPEGSILKCNTDGAYRGNPGRNTYSFCIRDCNGDLVYAQGEEIHEGTSIEAEALDIKEEITHCVTVGITQIYLETDSLVLFKILTRVWGVPWNIVVIIEDIWYVSRLCQTQIKHIYREGNKLADFLANMAFDINGRFEFHEYSALPEYAKKILKLDKQQVPTLRIRMKKIIQDNTRGKGEATYIS